MGILGRQYDRLPLLHGDNHLQTHQALDVILMT